MDIVGDFKDRSNPFTPKSIVFHFNDINYKQYNVVRFRLRSYVMLRPL